MLYHENPVENLAARPAGKHAPCATGFTQI